MDKYSFQRVMANIRRGVECADDGEVTTVSAKLVLELVDWALYESGKGWKDDVSDIVTTCLEQYFDTDDEEEGVSVKEAMDEARIERIEGNVEGLLDAVAALALRVSAIDKRGGDFCLN